MTVKLSCHAGSSPAVEPALAYLSKHGSASEKELLEFAAIPSIRCQSLSLDDSGPNFTSICSIQTSRWSASRYPASDGVRLKSSMIVIRPLHAAFEVAILTGAALTLIIHHQAQ